MSSPKAGSRPLGEIYEYACVAAITAWVISRLFVWFLAPFLGAIVALAFGVSLSGLYMFWPGTAWVVALFSPVSLGVALYALADLVPLRWLVAPKWRLPELGIASVAYIGFLVGSLGALPFSLYAYGFDGQAMAALTVAGAGYALFRRDLVMGATIAGAQGLWLADIGSENLFDHLVSLLVIPAMIVAALRRLRGR